MTFCSNGMLMESRSPPDGGTQQRRGEQMRAEGLFVRGLRSNNPKQKARREHLLGASQR